eukprot:TRINITY_DN2254_c0_g2_i1.p1 TRINITY_DN2254_c0_g2~~TRINITY_DN2254_c0_g2_i1.p1  ORF type:complete len:263 (-),score=43.93 TRINITY_DN2254_c0_g2_i1:145-861(-)
MKEIQNAITSIVDDFVLSIKSHHCPQCRNSLYKFIGDFAIPLASKLKQNIIAAFNKPEDSPAKRDAKTVSLTRLRIVLLRRLNETLEKNLYANETPKEVLNLRNAISELDDKLKSGEKAKTVCKSPVRNVSIEISQSPLLLSDKTFTCDLAEITARNSDEIKNGIEMQSPDSDRLTREFKISKSVLKVEKAKPIVKGIIKKVKMKNKENVNLGNIPDPYGRLDLELTKVQICRVLNID